MTDGATSRVAGVVAKLSALDRFLPVWIGAAMVAGLLLGRLDPRAEHRAGKRSARRHFAADRARLC